MLKEEIIDRIVNYEWKMFIAVNNIGGKASCQNDQDSFNIMRKSQFYAFDMPTLESYCLDLEKAKCKGRNLLTEKYGYMMEYTEPEYFNTYLKDKLPSVDQNKASCITSIISHCRVYYDDLKKDYANVLGTGRGDKIQGLYPDVETYLMGELKTYSCDTLKKLEHHVKVDKNFIRNILENTAKCYGYETLERAEEDLKC